MKSLTLLLFLSPLYLLSYSQEVINLPNEPYGSAGELKGNNLIVNCFVSVKKENWTDIEKSSMLMKESECFEWIKKQARLKNVKVSFDTIVLGMDSDIVVPKIKSSHEPQHIKIDWVPYVLHVAGYKNTNDFYDSLKRVKHPDNIAVIMFLKEPGRSYAQVAYEAIVNYNKEMFLEGAVVYKVGEIGEKDIKSNVIAHELLKLYGAWSLDHEENRDPAIEKRVSGAFQHSIMYHENKLWLSTFDIDALNAWRLGWTKSYWPWFDIFKPNMHEVYWKDLPGLFTENKEGN